MTDLAVAGEPQTQAIQLLLDLEQTGALDEVSLTLSDPDMSFERWEDLGRFLGGIDRRARWYIGDWLNFGEALFGDQAAQGVEATPAERYSEAERITGLDHGTLMNIRSVCGKVPRTVRRKELGFWIHAEVAKLDHDEQVVWLQRTIDNGLTKSDLRQAIRDEKNPPNNDTRNDGDDGGNPPAISIAERIETAARLVYEQGQNNSDGDFVVPATAWAQLRAALGEE